MFTYTETDAVAARGLGVLIESETIACVPSVHPLTQAEKALSHVNECYHHELLARHDAQATIRKKDTQLCYWQITAGLLFGAAFVLGLMVLVRPV